MVKKKKGFQWQMPMKKILWALSPALLASIYFYGWRVLVLLIVANGAAFLSEYIFAKQYGDAVSSSVFVTATLFTMTLPPTLPFWMAAVGVIFAIVFGKMVFGGFGKNIFNPALVGRAFIYVSFAVYMTGHWVDPVGGSFGGFMAWQSDAVTSATVLATAHGTTEQFWLSGFLGRIAGSVGETSAILLIPGGIYLVWKKIANKTLVFSTFGGMVVLQTIFWYLGVRDAMDPLTALLNGGFLLGMFFMVTDPVTAPKTDTGKLLYGLLIGTLTVLIRTFSVWPEGMMFAILLGNMFGPITDYYVKEAKKKKKAKAAATAGV